MTRAVSPNRQRPVLLVGSGVIAAGLGDAVVTLAERTRTGVLNTYCAKGLFAFDHPAHLGTVGLQHDDLTLASVTGPDAVFSPVIAVGVGPNEVAGGPGESWHVVDPADLPLLDLPVADVFPDRPPLYAALAQVCGPLYGDDSVPLSPVRAAGDLAVWLPANTVVVASGGLAGFWIGRTFPTRRPATVWLPAGVDPGFVDRTVAQQVAAGKAVVVVAGPGDPPVSPDATGTGATVIVEHWLPDGPELGATQRIEQLDQALGRARQASMSHGHGADQRLPAQDLPAQDLPAQDLPAQDLPVHSLPVQHLSVGVRCDELTAMERVAGAVTAWGGVAGR